MMNETVTKEVLMKQRQVRKIFSNGEIPGRYDEFTEATGVILLATKWMNGYVMLATFISDCTIPCFSI